LSLKRGGPGREIEYEKRRYWVLNSKGVWIGMQQKKRGRTVVVESFWQCHFHLGMSSKTKQTGGGLGIAFLILKREGVQKSSATRRKDLPFILRKLGRLRVNEKRRGSLHNKREGRKGRRGPYHWGVPHYVGKTNFNR